MYWSMGLRKNKIVFSTDWVSQAKEERQKETCSGVLLISSTSVGHLVYRNSKKGSKSNKWKRLFH